ncbi:MAG: endopeptidase La [Candidatus Cloacimonetes bacterium]|nr:endopeptidase La [Candidatus Cloacimonadota bacterium]
MDTKDIKIPNRLPVIKTNNIVLFPFLIIPLVITDEYLKKVVEMAIEQNNLFTLFLQHDGGKPKGLYQYGTVVNILQMRKNLDNSMSLLLQGLSRTKLVKISEQKPVSYADIEIIPEQKTKTPQIMALKKICLELFENVILESTNLNEGLISGLAHIKQPGRIADIIAGNAPIKLKDKQKILETVNLKQRFEKLNEILTETIKQLRLENDIRSDIQLEMDEDQRKYYLHEQLEAIQKELGETSEVDQEIGKWKELIKKAKLPEYVEKVASEELERLSVMPAASSEYSIIRNYLDWIVKLPWKYYSKDRLNLKKIDEILAHDHYGLDNAKERITEYIAVKKLKNDKMKGPILCFVGPPGVGKTSLGKSIARALNRKFIRISLGGIHDEAEVRGHRKTYIGAMPGKIINEIKRAGTANPLFMLDEIDKVGRDYRGDPSSALLEVLDPEQNNTFVDNYLNLPFDLSEVMFITTANSLETVPHALKDRMELIEFSSYIEEEKIEIARKYLIPREAENNGVSGKYVRISKSALQELIRYYIREAGVRTLQRRIGAIMRKVAKKIASGETNLNYVTDKNMVEYLGRRKYTLEIANRIPQIGIVTGLAWTIYGGEILFCESSLMPGKGKLILTGLLGEVMQESARIALSYLKTNFQELEIDREEFDKNDIHIHLPAGAVPKDGPSAGVTLITSLVSLFTRKKINHEIAMTGELTLQGKILPVGGIREKILAAKRSGIKEVILPEENRNNFIEIPEKSRAGIKVDFINSVEEVFKLVMI